MLYIGIDMGTSSVKLLLMDGKGKTILQQEESYAVRCPQEGWREMDPEIWYEKTISGLRVLLKGINRQEVSAVGITGQMHSTVFLDQAGKPVRPAILWNDTRTREEAAILKEQTASSGEIGYLSNIVSTGSPAANLFWLRRHEPDRFQSVEHLLIGPDYLAFRLAGTYGTDYCQASTSSLFDLKKREWSEEMRRILGAPPRIFPEVMGSACPAGRLIPDIAEELGLCGDVLVIRGTGDNAAAAFAAKALLGERPVISLGTSGVLIWDRKQPDFSRKGKNILFSSDGRRFDWIVQGAVQACGSSIEWWAKKILGADSFDALDLAEGQACENELIFYPHLNGDKTLFGDAGLRGAFLGIGLDTARQDMSAAVLEGICFAFRELLEKMGGGRPPGLHIGVVGGGAKNNCWMQMMADVLQAEILRLDGTISAACGAALLAAGAIGGAGALQRDIQRGFVDGKSFHPRIEKQEYYAEKYKKYLRTYKALSYIRAGENGCRE